ncbi:sugar ABC transporter substrate-binding protein [Sphaerimonospora sp. CA-214678]|uniref:sugar ABC transporter substrate-binding protein n=1 Tax=Sphaerimonospora sp. CA-214678 TaxID=3240029 RepID=UPI003D8B48B4
MKRASVGRRGRRDTFLGILAAAAAISLAACSSSSASSMGEDVGKSVSLDSMKPVTQYVGPTTAFTAPRDKHIAVVVCGNFGAGCVREGHAVKEAGETLGWKVDLIDGRLDPTVQNRAVKQAAESGVDGIVGISANPNLMGEAMAEVAARKIPYVAMSQAARTGDVAGVTSYVSLAPQKSGKIIAQWLEAASDSKAHVLILDLPGTPDIMDRNDVIASTLKDSCAECKVYRAEVSAQTVGTSLAPLVTAQLQQHPDISYVWVLDDAVGEFVAQGIRQAGKSSTVKMAGTSSSTEASIGHLKDGTQTADLLWDDYWGGWVAVDSLARAMAGEPVQKEWETPLRLFTPANVDQLNSDADKVGWRAEFDYKSKLRQLWGAR